jgi:hypothetical protein
MSGIGISLSFIRSDNGLDLTAYCMALRLDRKDLLPSRCAKLETGLLCIHRWGDWAGLSKCWWSSPPLDAGNVFDMVVVSSHISPCQIKIPRLYV